MKNLKELEAEFRRRYGSKAARIGVLSDLHCGHVVGMTSPNNWKSAEATDPRIRKIYRYQKEHWEWLEAGLRKHGPFTHLLLPGDLVDGPGTRAGGRETIVESLDLQVDMAFDTVRLGFTQGITNYIGGCGGTNYHTKTVDGAIDLESLVYDKFKILTPNVFYDPVLWISLNIPGLANPFIIKTKHKTPKGSIQTGGAAPGAIRQQVQTQLLTVKQNEPDTDMLFLGHCHELHWHEEVTGSGKTYYTVTVPALQGRGSEYGLKECNSVTVFGFMILEIAADKDGLPVVSHQFVTKQLKSDMVKPHVWNV